MKKSEDFNKKEKIKLKKLLKYLQMSWNILDESLERLQTHKNAYERFKRKLKNG